MVGYGGLYRGGAIFAALPRSRAMKSPTSIMFKIASVTPAILESARKDPRVDTVSRVPGAGWFFFDLNAPSATQSALGWIGRAHQGAKKEPPHRPSLLLLLGCPERLTPDSSTAQL